MDDYTIGSTVRILPTRLSSLAGKVGVVRSIFDSGVVAVEIEAWPGHRDVLSFVYDELEAYDA